MMGSDLNTPEIFYRHNDKNQNLKTGLTQNKNKNTNFWNPLSFTGAYGFIAWKRYPAAKLQENVTFFLKM